MVTEKESKVSIGLNPLFCYCVIICIGKTMALYQASDFTGFSDSYAGPAGSSDVIFTGSVDVILPAGITQQVFGTLSTALKCIHFMEMINYNRCHLMKMLLFSISGLKLWF